MVGLDSAQRIEVREIDSGHKGDTTRRGRSLPTHLASDLEQFMLRHRPFSSRRRANSGSRPIDSDNPTYHYKSRFDGRFSDLAVRPRYLRPLFTNDAYTPMRMRNKSYADNSSLITDSPVLQSPPAWASIVPPDCALVEFLSCAIRISASSILICSSISRCCLKSAMLRELLIAAALVSRQ